MLTLLHPAPAAQTPCLSRRLPIGEVGQDLGQGHATGKLQQAVPGSSASWTTALSALPLPETFRLSWAHCDSESHRLERLSESPGATFVQLQVMLAMIFV